MTLDQKQIQSVVESVLSRLAAANVTAAPAAVAASSCGCGCAGSDGDYGVFTCVDKAADAAHHAHLKLKKAGIGARAKVIEIVKTLAVANAEPWGRFEMDETKIGRVDHKIGKLLITKNVPGVEFLRPDAMSGDGGIMMEEFAPFGVAFEHQASLGAFERGFVGFVQALRAGDGGLCGHHPAAVGGGRA